ncbi:MAG: DUF2917 domain-containing protein [Geobacter sp.]|nr:DUF2917 domain-containing protein [Geobacter sp.]
MELFLRKGEVRTIPCRVESFIDVSSGVVWITRYMDSRDYLLKDIQGFKLESGEPLVVEALTDSYMTVKTLQNIIY